jgi:hypothetical protein
MNIEKMKKIGGKEWKVGDYHRIYFNNLINIFGLECALYNTGNISSASINGKTISNTKAKEIITCLEFGKVWFDVNDGEFHFKIFGCREYTGDEIGKIIIDRIKSKLEA